MAFQVYLAVTFFLLAAVFLLDTSADIGGKKQLKCILSIVKHSMKKQKNIMIL